MDTSYQLNPEEFGVFADRKFMPLKQSVWKKLEGSLSVLADRELELIQDYEALLEIELNRPMPKISRGENYHSYSYRVLDYPRLLEKDHMFLFRCMLLWGHPIGFHLILSGKFQEAYAEKLVLGLKEKKMEVYYAAQDSPWIWEKDAKGLELVDSNSGLQIHDRSFFKLSTFLPIGDYRKIPSKG
ncbi:MAG: hypothetical protein AAF696_15400, partial [Bacteroidota bacterium]